MSQGDSPRTGHRLRRRHRLGLWLLLPLLLALLVALAVLVPVWFKLEHPAPPPGGPPVTESWQLPAIPPGDRRVLLLLIDGLAVDPFERALADGRLPNLQRLMETRPTSAVTAVATFPSATSPSVQELLSGRYVNLENLPVPGAVHAFDRDERTVMRYVTEPDAWQWPVPTLFDALGDRQSVTVFEGRWDGPLSILTQYNLMGQAFLEAIGAAALSGGDRGPVEAYLRLLEAATPPVVSLVVLNEFDISAHFHGPQSEQAQRALEKTDRLIGDIVNSLSRAQGGLAETSIVLFGDHGMAPSGRHVDLAAFFARRGLTAVDVSTVTHVLFRERLGSLWTSWTDAVLVAGGSNITQVYLKNPRRGWQPPGDPGSEPSRTPEETAQLAALAGDVAALEGIDQVMWQDNAGVVHVVTAETGTAKIMTRTGGDRERRFAYLAPPVAGRFPAPDPLGYLLHDGTRELVCSGTEAPDRCFHTALEWIDASADSAYPGAVPLVPKAFKPAQFAGDLMVAAERGYTFLRGQFGDHGNLDRAAMTTPLVLNGPGVRSCEEPHQPRLVDIYPTVAVLLGASPDDPALANLDGRVLNCVLPAPARNVSAPPGS